MSEKIVLKSGKDIRDWAQNNSFDVVDVDFGSPRFFQARFTPTAGPMLLFAVEHTYFTDDGKPLVTVRRVLRSTDAEGALHQYLYGARDQSAGAGEYAVGFKTHMRPGASDGEAISLVRQLDI